MTHWTNYKTPLKQFSRGRRLGETVYLIVLGFIGLIEDLIIILSLGIIIPSIRSDYLFNDSKLEKYLNKHENE